MILYPAIDLKDGSCVRLIRGEAGKATVFNDDPAAQAQIFAADGCQWLHVVDLDGAFTGASRNGAAVEAILDNVKIPLQLGGGIRDLDSVSYWLERGVSRVILGTIAVRAPELVIEAARRFPEQIAVGIDARADMVAIEGWVQDSDSKLIDLARRYEDSGVATIIYTDITRDGVMQGPNVEATAELARALSIPVIASGGISSLADLQALAACRPAPAGAILGRALYEKAIDLREALKLMENS